ncbi:MAG: hypothetical protein ACTSU6_03220, partial [Candidatus Njordarchaeales archaeon]
NEIREYDFGLKDLARRRVEPFQLSSLMSSNIYDNPGYNDKYNALTGSTAASQNTANNYASLVGPSAFTQIASPAMGAWAGNWGK